jgi:hypothetical protein
MTSCEVTLPFLGDRTYLHGTTLLEALLAPHPDATDISFKFGQLISTDRVRIQRAEEGSATKPAASLVLRDSGKNRVHLSVFPQLRSAEVRRESFDEHMAANCAKFEVDCLTLHAPVQLTTVKTIVALNKGLLSRLLAPPAPGQWLFTRLEVSHYPRTFQQVSVSYRARSGFAAVVSDINVDTEAIGQIMFSWRISQ